MIKKKGTGNHDYKTSCHKTVKPTIEKHERKMKYSN